MKVMVRFYVRGEAAKKSQYDDVMEEMAKIDANLKMAGLQKASLQAFPSFHPKRKSYEQQIDEEVAQLNGIRENYAKQAAGFLDLHHWGTKIVATMHWLEGNLKHYGVENLNLTFDDLEPIRLTPEDYLKFKGGLEEVTYNLQESQDFFEASLDGRLQTYHQLERCMIEAQLKVLKDFPEDDPRRAHVESELAQDLAFVIGNMEENPKVKRHRERMQTMHKDFFALLKWQRKKMLSIITDEPEKIIGDIEKLRQDLEAMRQGKEFHSKFAVPPTTTGSSSGGACPVTGTQGSGAGCPVDNVDMARAMAQMAPEGKASGFIKNLYEEP